MSEGQVLFVLNDSDFSLSANGKCIIFIIFHPVNLAGAKLSSNKYLGTPG